MSEWKEYKLGDVAIITDCEHKTAPTVKTSEYYSIRTSNISQGKIDYENSNRVDYKTYVKWTNRTTPKTGDIILAREAPVGEVGIIKKGYNVCLGQRTVLISVKEKNVNNKYLLYYLTNPLIKFELTSRSTGSVVEHLNMKDIRAFKVSLPSFPEQKAIASVLSSLDEKIDLLHRQNKTLEAMAETLFRQWFVEEAKDDWRDIELSEIAKFKNGKSRPKKEGNYPIYGGNGVLGYANEFNAENKSIIIGRVGAYCGSLYFENQKIWISDNAILGIAKNAIYLYFIFYLLKSINLNDLAEGSSHPLLTQTLLNKIELKSPPSTVLAQFNIQIEQYFRKKEANSIQIRILEKTRDTLLPKLMSGKVRVKL